MVVMVRTIFLVLHLDNLVPVLVRLRESGRHDECMYSLKFMNYGQYEKELFCD